MGYGILVALTYAAWFPVVLTLFAVLPARRAVLIGVLAGWMFLPVAEYVILFLPEINKMAVISFSVLLGIALFDGARILAFRPRWFDLPIAILCLVPVTSSLANGLGIYDGLSSVLQYLVHWGLVYFIGRLYFSDLEGLRELTVALFIGGLIYVPLCLYEVRMSPQLHRIVYGYHQHSMAQHMRFGGWRPKVFMDHGLMVGMWMTSATLCGLWLWWTGARRRFLRVPMGVWVGMLLVTTILVKATAGIVLLAIGVPALAAVRYFRSYAPLAALTVLPFFYVAIRLWGLWSGQGLVDLVEDTLGQDRAQSLAFRFENEDALAERAFERPLFGWGGWGRARVHDNAGKDVSVTDSQWIVTFGKNGLAGLAALFVTILLPAWLLGRRVPSKLWAHPSVAPCVVLALLLALWMVDNMVNAMMSPVFLLIIGGLTGKLAVRELVVRSPQAAPQTAAS